MLLFTYLARAAIASLLLGAGIRWLAQTTSITDLMLNAVALNAILDVDEFLFAGFTPISIQLAVQNLEPVKMKYSRQRSQLESFGLLILLIGWAWKQMLEAWGTLQLVVFTVVVPFLAMCTKTRKTNPHPRQAHCLGLTFSSCSLWLPPWLPSRKSCAAETRHSWWDAIKLLGLQHFVWDLFTYESTGCFHQLVLADHCRIRRWMLDLWPQAATWMRNSRSRSWQLKGTNSQAEPRLPGLPFDFRILVGCFLVVSLWFPCGFLVVSLWFPCGFLVVCCVCCVCCGVVSLI